MNPVAPIPANGKRYQSWGRYPKVKNTLVAPVYWRDDLIDLSQLNRPILPVGYARSYGDSCLNNDGILLDTTQLKRFIAFDTTNGVLRCEAGVSLEEILPVIVPQGWFLPVTPGTKYVSVAGAIANDVHGKNHHADGTFGCHVTQFELLRSNGERLICSPTENVDLFRATIGGLGLTGLILWAELQLKKVETPFFATEGIRFESLDEFWQLTAESVDKYRYTVSWLDCLIGGKHMGRGRFFRGNAATAAEVGKRKARTMPKLRVPVDIPSFLLNPLTVRMFNEAVYRSQLTKRVRKLEHYETYFYPLDSILDWNRCYGPQGFMQYQCVVPMDNDNRAIKAILESIRKSGEGSFLSVFKTFGSIQSPGMLSFPRPGVTLALDFAYHGQRTLKALQELDQIVIESGGALYPAKDARMSGASFRASFPNWEEFAKHVDPKFSSSFWRRVTQDKSA